MCCSNSSRKCFSIDLTGPTGGDELEMRWSFDGAKLIVRKQTVGGTGTFGITASDALTQTFNLTTTAANTPVASSTYALTNHAAPITLTESQVAGYVLTGATCTDQSGATVSATVNATTRQVVIPTSNYRANQKGGAAPAGAASGQSMGHSGDSGAGKSLPAQPEKASNAHSPPKK